MVFASYSSCYGSHICRYWRCSGYTTLWCQYHLFVFPKCCSSFRIIWTVTCTMYRDALCIQVPQCPLYTGSITAVIVWTVHYNIHNCTVCMCVDVRLMVETWLRLMNGVRSTWILTTWRTWLRHGNSTTTSSEGSPSSCHRYIQYVVCEISLEQ